MLYIDDEQKIQRMIDKALAAQPEEDKAEPEPIADTAQLIAIAKAESLEDLKGAVLSILTEQK